MAFNTKLAAALAVASLGFSACSGSGTSPAPVTQDNLNTDVLTFAVGTANIYGTASGLNFAAAYRQPAAGLHAGDSAVLVSQPTIALPFTLTGTAGAPYTTAPFGVADSLSTAETGPAPAEIGGTSITGTAQLATNVSTFGVSGGVFQTGVEPLNYNNFGVPFGENLSPVQVVSYPVPLYDPITNASVADAGSTAPDPSQASAWGGPPAFDLLGNGESPVGAGDTASGYAGVPEGLDVFQGLTPTAGAYTLSVTIPSNVAKPTYSKTATLTSTALLPTNTAAAQTADATGNGGAFAQTFPAGVTEGYIQVIDYGPATLPTADAGDQAATSCNGAKPSSPIYYTMEVTPAAATGTLGDTAGPSGAPSICTPAQNVAATNTAATGSGSTAPPAGDVTGDMFTVQSYGFDYPLYENTKSTRTQAMPPAATLTGTNGQADVTISAAVPYTDAVVVGTSASRFVRSSTFPQRARSSRFAPRI